MNWARLEEIGKQMGDCGEYIFQGVTSFYRRLYFFNDLSIYIQPVTLTSVREKCILLFY